MWILSTTLCRNSWNASFHYSKHYQQLLTNSSDFAKILQLRHYQSNTTIMVFCFVLFCFVFVCLFVVFFQAPDSKTLFMPVFFSSTCFRPSGAAQQQLGFLNFTSGSVGKWRLQWRNSGSPIERSVAHGTLISAPRYASAWKQRKRLNTRCSTRA